MNRRVFPAFFLLFLIASLALYFYLERGAYRRLDETDRLVLEALDKGMGYMHNLTVYDILVRSGDLNSNYTLSVILITAEYNFFFPPDDVTNVWLKRLVLNLTIKPCLNDSGVIDEFNQCIFQGRRIDVFRSIYHYSFYMITHMYGRLFELNDSMLFKSFLDNVSRDFDSIYGNVSDLKDPGEAWEILEELSYYGYPINRSFYMECYQRWLQDEVLPWLEEDGAWNPFNLTSVEDIKTTFTIKLLTNIFFTEYDWRRDPFKNRTWVSKALRYVLNHQHEDGSFGVTNESLYENPHYLLSSNIVTTLNAILLFMYYEDPSYYSVLDKAVRWIVSLQRDDGSWPGWVVGGRNGVRFVREANWTIPLMTQQVLGVLVKYAEWRGLNISEVRRKYYEPVELHFSGREKDKLVRYLLKARRLMFRMWDVEDYLDLFESDNIKTLQPVLSVLDQRPTLKSDPKILAGS